MRALTPELTKSRREESSYINVQQLLAMGLLFCSVLAVLAAPVPTNIPSNYPSWWFSRGVIAQTDSNPNPSYPTDYPSADDYAAINEGQLKNFAGGAYAELQADLPPYALTNSSWTNLSTMVNGWNPTTGDDYAAVNLGQLKTVSAAFYNVLIQVGYTNNYPWTGVGADDYAAANIGQAKNAFSFDTSLDTNGLPYWWEVEYFGQTGLNPTSSPDGNGLTLLQDYQQGNNPTNYYSQNGGTITPTITISEGNNQNAPQATFLAQPLQVIVTGADGAPLTNAVVTFSNVGSQGGQFSTCIGGSASSIFTVQTDATGAAQAYYAGPDVASATNSVQATSGTATATFSETTEVNNGTIASTTGLTVTLIANGQFQLTWNNNATNATYILVQQSTDNVNWTTTGTITDPTVTNYTVNVANPNQTYSFGIIPGAP